MTAKNIFPSILATAFTSLCETTQCPYFSNLNLPMTLECIFYFPQLRSKNLFSLNMRSFSSPRHMCFSEVRGANFIQFFKALLYNPRLPALLYIKKRTSDFSNPRIFLIFLYFHIYFNFSIFACLHIFKKKLKQFFCHNFY